MEHDKLPVATSPNIIGHDTTSAHNELFVVNEDRSGEIAELGLFAFGLTTMLASLADCEAYDSCSIILAMGIAYGGICQFITGILEWIKGDGFTGVAFSSYGSFWVAFVLIHAIADWGWAAGPSEDALGCFLLIWALFDLLLFFCTFNQSICKKYYLIF